MRQKVGPFPVTGLIHGVSGCDQRLRQLPRQKYLVLYDQNPQSHLYSAA